MLRLGPAVVRYTGRAEGDLGPGSGDGAELERRRRAVVDLTWRTVAQVHGNGVVAVDGGSDGPQREADALVTTVPGLALAVRTADCASIALASPEGVIGAVHAGWRGLMGGIVGAAVDEVRRLGGSRVLASLGPCIHPECYEFSGHDLDAVAAALGDGVRAETAAGAPALDVPAAVRAALAGAGAELVWDADSCTACHPDLWYSHRARREAERQALVVWRP